MRIIAGQYKGRQLKTTTGPGFRPAMGVVRESLFSMVEARGIVWEQTRVLDIFAGSGSLGFEALSRGAAFVTFIEKAPYAAKVIEKNAETLGISPNQYNIKQEDAHKALRKAPPTPYSLVFIDPPYQLNALGRCLKALFLARWLAPDAIINAEVEERLKFAAETAHPDLTLLADRAYGQTRVLLWNTNPL